MNIMNVKIGQTKVNVFRVNDGGQAQQIHRGIVVAANNSFLRVYNPEGFDKGGDVVPQASQWYAIRSARIYCELAGELRVPMTLPADI
jgi:hypothetical protein